MISMAYGLAKKHQKVRRPRK